MIPEENKSRLDENFRFTKVFGILYVISLAFFAILAKPWTFSLPIVSQIAATIFIPFAISIALYVPAKLLKIGATANPEEKSFFSRALITLVVVALLLLILFYKSGFEEINRLYVFIIVGAAFAFLKIKPLKK